jgi:adenylate cyclase
MRRVGKAPSRKNPRWCNLCFEKAPTGGATLTLGVLFADVRGSTAFAEQKPPAYVAAVMNRFYARLTQIIVRHGIVDKLIGDEVMGLYLPPLAERRSYWPFVTHPRLGPRPRPCIGCSNGARLRDSLRSDQYVATRGLGNRESCRDEIGRPDPLSG